MDLSEAFNNVDHTTIYKNMNIASKLSILKSKKPKEKIKLNENANHSNNKFS